MSTLPPPPPRPQRIAGSTSIPQAAQEEGPVSLDFWDGKAPPPAAVPRPKLWEPTWFKLRLLGLLGLLGLFGVALQPWTVLSTRSAVVSSAPCGTWDIHAAALPKLFTAAEMHLQGMAALADDNVWASGYRVERNTGQPETLIAHWNGRQLDFVPSPNLDISDLATNIVPIKLPGMAALAANDVWAIGASTLGTLTLHWDGVSWSRVASPNAGRGGYRTGLRGAAATAPDDVWAAGYSDDRHNPLILHWDGKAWSVSYKQDKPTVTIDNLGLDAITALSRDAAWAVGTNDQQTLTMRWDGKSWQTVPSPSPCRGFHQLNGVAGSGINDVWAVGACKDVENIWPDTPSVPLALHWDGAAWQRVAVPAPPGVLNVVLGAVAARSADDVWATGSSDSGALLYHWDGKAWMGHVVPVADPAQTPIFSALSLTPHTVWTAGAAGRPTDPASPEQALLARFAPAACSP